MRLLLIITLVWTSGADWNGSKLIPDGNFTKYANVTGNESELTSEASGEEPAEDNQFDQGNEIPEIPSHHSELPRVEDLQSLLSEEGHVEMLTAKPHIQLMRDDSDLEDATPNSTGTHLTTLITPVVNSTQQSVIPIGFYSLLRDKVLATGLIAGLISIALVAIFSLAVLALCQNYRKQHYGEWMVNGSSNYSHEIDPQYFENGGFMYDHCPISGVVERRLVLSGEETVVVTDHKPTGYDNPALELDESQGKQLGRWFVPLRTLELMEKIKTDSDSFEMTEKTDVILED